MIDIFIAYSHEDLAFKNEFKKFLRPMFREERIGIWDDYDIEAGQDWDATIKERLYGSDIILLLVSSDSLASDYFYGKEVKVSLERHQKGEAVVVPVILRHCDWENTPLGGLEAIPEKGRPVVEWATRDQAWQDTVSRLRRVVENLEILKKKEAEAAQAKRYFNAAIEAAYHLMSKQNWTEAQKALADALNLYRQGFSPDNITLNRQIEECKRAQEQVEVRRAFEERMLSFEKVFLNAEALFFQKKWKEAKKSFLESLSLWEGGFAPDSDAIRAQITHCEENIQETENLAEQTRLLEKLFFFHLNEAQKNFNRNAWQKAVEAADKALQIRPDDVNSIQIKKEATAALLVQKEPSKSKFKYKYLIIRLGGLLGLTILAWVIFNSPPNQKEQLKPSTIENTITNTEDDVYKAALTIPDLIKYIDDFPQGKHYDKAKKKVKDLQNEFDRLVNDGQILMSDYPSKACIYFKNALAINPDNQTVIKRINKLRCK